MGNPDYYAVLGVPHHAEQEKLKAAYRRLAIAYHPDKHPDDPEATSRVQRIVQAYNVLSDPKTRQRYDDGHQVQEIPIESGTNFQEFFGSIIDGVFGVGIPKPERGRDRKYRLALTLEEVARGARKVLDLPHEEPCSRCSARGFLPGCVPEVCGRCEGAGEIQRRKTLRSKIQDCPDCLGRGYRITEPCPRCKGTTIETVVRPVTITVPAGVKHGAKLLIRHAGQPGRHGGEPGDCFVHIKQLKHPSLVRDGLTLRSERPITVFDALLGARISVRRGGATTASALAGCPRRRARWRS